MESDTVVILDPSEYMQACMVGVMRCVQDVKRGYRHRHGAQPERAEEYSIRGAVGEACVAKYLGRYWLGVGTLGGSDVGPYQVRATAIKDIGLRLNEWDKEDDVFVGVYVVEGRGYINGWIYARDGKACGMTDRFKNGRPAFFVPKEAMQPMETLPL